MSSLRMLFLNAENLFSPNISFYGSSYTQEEYESKINWMGELIANKGVHIVGLTEVGSDATTCINDLIQSANEKDRSGLAPFTHFVAGESNPGFTRIRNVIISRYPIVDHESYTDFPAGFQINLLRPGTSSSNPNNWDNVPYRHYSRPILRGRVELPNGRSFHLFVVHLKSKRPSLSVHDNYNEAIGIARSAIKRNAEAAALRFFFDDFLPNQYEADDDIASIVMGDFNDGPTSVPLQNIRGAFDANIGPASNWSNLDKKRLISCARMHLKFTAYEDKLYSYIYEENFSLLDQAFVTQHLTSKFLRMEMYNDHVVRHQLSRSSTEEFQQFKSSATDHGAIVIEFKRML